MLVFRFLVAAYNTGWLIYSGFHEANGKTKWFIYLTNWGYLLETVYFIYASAVTLWFHIREKKNKVSKNEKDVEMDAKKDQIQKNEDQSDFNFSDLMRYHHSLMWILFNIAADTAVLISIIYWGWMVGPIDGLDVSTHALNTVFMILELVLSKLPIRLLHCIYPLVFGLCYMIFTVVYWAAGGTNANNKPYIYSIVDYKDSPGMAVGILLGALLVLLPIVHSVFFGVYKLRCYLSERSCGKTNA
ncbi:protein rolling stone isoform X2 [Nematostella vectensis]|nr:protein rolling stone isoform X2 [Nematostella vectensis]